ncbi:TetR/AcrR family transcriptional regulator [Streptomyces sp. NPDC001255]|uniref:TetR/AcrR family transcriptional regulator n=1 Tax=Streptomyces sp. NPDC001255 TaxID=3364550 RepID=UPI0036CDF3E3
MAMQQGGPTMREIGRRAVRTELARVAFVQFCSKGFTRVTFDELAAAAGVSRSTFLRYFRTKEDVALVVFEPVGGMIIDGLSGAPSNAGSSGVLRSALHAVVDVLQRDVVELLAVVRLVNGTPELRAALLAKQATWQAEITEAIRAAGTKEDVILTQSRVASALACLFVAFHEWGEREGRDPLPTLLELSLSALR